MPFISFLPCYLLLFIALYLSSENTKYEFIRIINKRKKVKRKMPTELIKEFIGKNCVISVFNEGAVSGTLVSVEENWLKIDAGKKGIMLINGDLVKSISAK